MSCGTPNAPDLPSRTGSSVGTFMILWKLTSHIIPSTECNTHQ